MIYWIFGAITVVSLFFFILANIDSNWYRSSSWDLVYNISVFPMVIAGFIFLIMTPFVIFCNVNPSGQLAAAQKERESIVYQYENNLYNGDFEISERELMNEIKDWNSKIASGKIGSKDFWVGIFYPNIYEELEFIELGENASE